MATQALHFTNANNGVHWHTASCVLRTSKPLAPLGKITLRSRGFLNKNLDKV